MSRNSNPTTPEERAEWRKGPWNPLAHANTLRLLDDIEERDRLLERAREDLEDWHQGHHYDDTISLISDIRALLSPSPEEGAPDGD